MKYPKIPLAQHIIQLCKAKDINHVVISPGSRNAPLTIGFAAHPEIQTYSIVDERCAAFFALGMAQQLQQPVAVVCTSGSALLNYYPAVAEAYYSDIPLVVISADRPKHLIDVGDGQTIRQEDVFHKHILYTANLKQDLEENEERFSSDKDIPTFVLDKLLAIDKVRVDANQMEINRAINIARTQKGPVHINAPFAEPLYETQDTFSEAIQEITPEPFNDQLNQEAFQEFLEHWNGAQKRMVMVGVQQPNTIDEAYINLLGEDQGTVVFTESTSNIHHPNFFPSIDKIIAPLTDKEFQELQPDVLVTFGGLIVSKKIKAFLRTYKPKAHYHINSKKAFDTFFSLTHHFKVTPNTFFKGLSEGHKVVESNYQAEWLTVKAQRAYKHTAYVKDLPFSDFKAFEHILGSIPNERVVHLSNSSTIRYVQLFDDNPNIINYCNRGTSGIDGSTSTALGHAVISEQQNLLITGDLSFFYDSNALWNNYIPKNFRIIVINNSGGGIFRILPGQKNTPDFDTYFETKHNLTAEHLCKMYGFEYQSADGEATLQEELTTFFDAGDQPRLLEVFTPRTLNDQLLIDYFKHFID